MVYGCKLSELLPRNQYPSAPLDPEARQEWIWRRNAQLQGAKTEAEIEARVQSWREQRDGAQLAKPEKLEKP